MMGRSMRWAAMALTVAAVAACHGAPDPNAPRRLTDDVSISGQIMAADVKSLRDKGFKAIVNMRPDNEAPEQANYAKMQAATVEAGLGYGYVPVKAGPVSRVSVKSMASTLDVMPKPVLLYAESADIPARVWALAEASRPDGLDQAAILAAVKSAGLSADDLASQIAARVAARPKH